MAKDDDQEGEEKGGGKLPDTLAVVILLFPGFLSERVSEYFSSAPKVSDMQLVAAALAATVVNLTIAVLIWGGLRLFSKRRFIRLPFLRVGFLILVFAVSVVTGLVWAVIDSSNYLFQIGVTQRASRADPWETAFQTNAKRARPYHVRVVTEDAGVYHGLPVHYPQGGADRTLVLDLAQREISSGKPGELGRCVPVGLDVHGRAVILGDQILAIEFRPKTDVGGNCEYRCDIPAGAKLCR